MTDKLFKSISRIFTAVLLVWIFGAAMGLITWNCIDDEFGEEIQPEWLSYEMYKRINR